MADSHSDRNYCLDFVKGIACICVVFMHCEFPGKLGTLVQCVARFCVPYFFMVSGYFSYYKDGRKYPAGRKIKHILTIVVAASVFYTLVAVVRMLLLNAKLSVSIKDIASLALFNKPFIIAGQLWFLFALLYVYIMYAVVDKLNFQKIAYYSIPFLIICYIGLAQGCHLIGKSVPNMIYRNFLIEGFPLFMLGHLIHKHQDSIVSKLTNIQLISIIAVSTFLCIPERYIFGRDFGVNISTFPQVAAIFVFAVKNGNTGEKSILTKLGMKYSLFVYVIHPFVWHTLEDVYSKIGIDDNTVAMYIMPILVLALTIVLSIIVEKVIKRINNRNKEVRA